MRQNKPFLIMPNHIALVDPQILFAVLSKYTAPAPVVAEMYANLPVVKHLFRWLGTIAVADVGANAKPAEVREAFSGIISALRNGQSVLLYPAGQIAGQGAEALFNRQAGYIAVSQLPPNTRVIGVRTRGLWGSMWSRAWLGKSPPFVQTFVKAIGIIIANGIFFAPRREVHITFEDITESTQQAAASDLQKFNRSLEEFYNQPGEERVNYLSHFWFMDDPERSLPEHIEGSVAAMRSVAPVNIAEIDQVVLKRVQQIIAKQQEITKAKVQPGASLIFDLGYDSLGLAELRAVVLSAFQQQAKPPIECLKTVADICQMAEGKIVVELTAKPCTLHEHTANASALKIDKQQPLTEQIRRVCKRFGESPFAYDETLGTLSCKDFYRKVIVVSHILKTEFNDKQIGIMLPASTSSALLVAACWFAGKTPVMLNFTLGQKHILSCAESAQVKHILTAKVFHSKIREQLPSELKTSFVFLENLLLHTSKTKKLIGLVKSFVPIGLFPEQLPNEPAVILFTSGSEAAPKMVPLSPQNLLADLWGTLQNINVKNSETLFSYLPPFHSFGFTAGIVLPLISGLRVAYSPNPGDAAEALRVIKAAKASVILTTPTFLRFLLDSAKQQDLASLKLAISGAEACPAPLIKKLQSLTNKKAELLEGYGITECSPVISINPPGKTKVGSVGLPIKGLFALITDPETFTTIPAGESGMIFVHGQSVFNGYGGNAQNNPFVEINNQQWYKTGDIGYIDEDGYLFLTGRLSRFVKIGGEMISLPFLENILCKEFSSDSAEPEVAVEAIEDKKQPKITLFTTQAITKAQANTALQSNGVANIMHIDGVKRVEAIPTLGTGKIDYKSLKNLT